MTGGTQAGIMPRSSPHTSMSVALMSAWSTSRTGLSGDAPRSALTCRPTRGRAGAPQATPVPGAAYMVLADKAGCAADAEVPPCSGTFSAAIACCPA